MDSTKTNTPWSWHPPPLPKGLLLLNKTETPATEIWHRPFWGIEAISASSSFMLPGITDMILSCQLSFAPGYDTSGTTFIRPLDHHIVRSVVRALRFGHPTIASRYAWPDQRPASGKHFSAEEGRFAYEVPRSERHIDLWLSEVVFDRSDVLVKANNNLDDAIRMVRRELGMASAVHHTTAFQLHHIPSGSPTGTGTHAIVLRLGHTLFDAIGTFQLMELFVAKLAEFISLESITKPYFAWGEEVLRLAGPFPDRSKVPWSADKLAQDYVMIQKLHEAMTFAQKAHGIPISNTNAVASTTGNFLRTISPENLSKLLAITRHHRCTIFSVLFAVEMVALLRVNPPDHKDDITTPYFPSAINLRSKYLAKDQQDRTDWEVSGALAFNVILARDLGRFVPDDRHNTERLVSDVFVLATEIHAQLVEQKPYMDRASFWVHELLSAVVTSAASVESSPPIPVPTLSSLGVVDTHLSASHCIASHSHSTHMPQLSVTNPIFTVCSPYAPHSFPLIVHPYTWAGTLYVSFSFPEAYMGSVEELMKGGRVNDGNKSGSATVLDVVEEFMSILETVAESGRE